MEFLRINSEFTLREPVPLDKLSGASFDRRENDRGMKNELTVEALRKFAEQFVEAGPGDWETSLNN